MVPKTFFLNERQELSSFEREGGGRAAQYVRVDWDNRSSALTNSFRKATAPHPASHDPMSSRHSFVVAVPAQAIQKLSKSKRATEGVVSYAPSFGGEQSKVFRKIGMDLIETLPRGMASVHIADSERLIATMEALTSASEREKSRWINFSEFLPLNRDQRVDEPWIRTVDDSVPVETWLRFQPTLKRSEINELLQAIAALLAPASECRLTRAGREFSGRYWCVGLLKRRHIEQIADEFPSVQSIHPRYATPIAAASRRITSITDSQVRPKAAPVNISQLPTVAIVDSGIPENHVTLAPYRRPGYRNPNLDPLVRFMGDHGSNVASCAVYGHIDGNSGNYTLPPPRCRVMDVMVSLDEGTIDDEVVIPAIEAVVGTAPDVRVFNLSFDVHALDGLPPIRRREELIKLQDMDNLAFARDVVLVISAGNTSSGLVPEIPYPHHVEDARWALGARARSFNGVVCGGYVDTIGSNTVAGIQGAPSPFTKVGPGLCDSPVPGFGAPAGDSTETYNWAQGTGVGVISPSGLWEDHNGTSFAAPIVAAEAARVCQELSRHCDQQTVPFAGTVKAWMNLDARRPQLSAAYERLAKRTIGRGLPSADGLRSPSPNTAVFIWQGVLQAAGTVSRVRLPVPLEWLKKASQPRLRLIAAWNGPVNMALGESWACRKVATKVRPFGAKAALLGGGQSHGGYPLIDRTFDIHPSVLTKKGHSLSEDLWVVEVEYEEIGDYPPAMTISPQQRVGAVFELADVGKEPLSPQTYVQSLPIAADLDRLSALSTPILSPIAVRQ